MNKFMNNEQHVTKESDDKNLQKVLKSNTMEKR